jgi:DNA-directed RNA polymerase specialized sigma24 family protein
MATDEEFTTFAAARSGSLFRTACLLCGDRHLAEDLVQITLARLYASWHRVGRSSSPAAYARTTLVRSYLSHRRLRRNREAPAAILPDRAAAEPDHTVRIVLLAALRDLRRLDRAVIVLRYWEDLDPGGLACPTRGWAGTTRGRACSR